jgi:phosphate starvation-inducible protein PhoH
MKLIIVLYLSCLFLKTTAGVVIKRVYSKDPSSSSLDKYIPRGDNQKYYVDTLNNNNAKIVIATGPAGTGKTLFPCIRSIEMLLTGKIDKIVITRPLVTVEENLGFLPGKIDEKMSPWTRPIFDIFLEYYSKKELDSLLLENTIEIAPLAFMRGRTFKDTFIIADEMQNSSPGQMQMLTTRIGKGSRLFITGDLEQSDRRAGGDVLNGLTDIVGKMAAYYGHNPTVHKMTEVIALDANDVQRSKIVKHMIDIYAYNYYYRPKMEDMIAC